MSIQRKTEEIASDYLAFVGRHDRTYISVKEYLMLRNAALHELQAGLTTISNNETELQTRPTQGLLQANTTVSQLSNASASLSLTNKEDTPCPKAASSTQKQAEKSTNETATPQFQAPKKDKKSQMLANMRAFDN